MKKAILLLATLVLLFGCNRSTDKKAELDKLRAQRDKLNEQILKLESEIEAEGGSTLKLKQVAITPVEAKVFSHYIEIQGKVDGDDNIALSSKMAGFVTYIPVVQGQQVYKGQLLATFDDQVMQQSMQELETALTYATDLYNKQKNLWDQNIGSEVQYLAAKNGKEGLENKIKTLKEQLDMMKIKSPINGTVEEIPIKVGQYVAPGMTTFRVVNFTHIKVTAEIAEAYSPKVSSGDSVVIYFPDFDQEIKTKLSFTSKFINPTNRTFQVECRLTPGKNEFRANMIAIIKIQDYKADNAITLPVNIIQKSMDETFVFVIREEGGKKFAKKQKIEIGQSYNGLVEITSGLKTGDKFITTGYQELNDGQQVNF
jgi:membrane fusion protein (multidrug efflux system)